MWKLLLRANNKPQKQERRPLKIHFTIQLGYFTGVKKEGGMPESILVQYMASFIYILWRRMGQQRGPLFHLLTKKMILPLGPIISESHLKSCSLYSVGPSTYPFCFWWVTTRSKCSLEDLQDCITLFIVRYSSRWSVKYEFYSGIHLLFAYFVLIIKKYFNFTLPLESTNPIPILVQVILNQADLRIWFVDSRLGRVKLKYLL